MRIVLEKGDSEEQKKMAEALLANKVICAIERVDYSCQKVQKSDDEVAKAVIEVVGLFGVSTQWAAVYRVLVDFCGWDSDFSRFCHRMNRLLKDVRLERPCNYQAIQKPIAANRIMGKDFQDWKNYQAPKGDRVFLRQMFIARKLLKLLSINA